MTPQVWAAVLAVFAALIAADLVFAKGAEGLRAAAVLSGLWIAAAVAFGGALWLWQGPAIAGQYFAGYLLEKALSVDNIFVFVVLFASLGLPVRLQRRVLQVGVLGALVLRGGLIAAGGALIEHIGWIFYVFGALVLLAGVRMLRPGPDPGAGLIARWRARTGAAPLLAALIAVETTDLVFALDSIPAVFGVTSNLFVVFTSNAFAVLGLRALYFLVAGSVRRFSFLKPAIAVLLMFIGVKMLLSPFVHLPVTVTLAAIVVVAGCAVAASLWRNRSLP